MTWAGGWVAGVFMAETQVWAEALIWVRVGMCCWR
ncbi:MAG: hypothetical protein RJA56_1625, partial [Pseudomonadota bacterium]